MKDFVKHTSSKYIYSNSEEGNEEEKTHTYTTSRQMKKVKGSYCVFFFTNVFLMKFENLEDLFIFYFF